jgi:hypothetical protein
MKASVLRISKPNPDLSYIVTYKILNDDDSAYSDDLDLKVEKGQSAKELLKQKLAEYEATLSAIDVQVGEEV